MSKIIKVELPHGVLTEQDDEEKQKLKNSITMSSALFWMTVMTCLKAVY
jgi:hypothetical protein